MTNKKKWINNQSEFETSKQHMSLFKKNLTKQHHL
jgi:hypothetical protein